MLIIYLNHIKLLAKIAIVFLVAIFALSFSQKTFAATGILNQINFQGKVVNANGTNVANGNYSFVFSLYTVATGGTNIWTETKTLTVTDGIFRTALGDTTTLPGSVDFNTDNIYLGINFNSDGEMTPRVRFTAVPYAFNALKVAGLTVTDTTGTFTLAAAKTLTVNNTLTFAGTDATTLTFQGTDTYVGRATTDTLTNKTIGSTGLTFSAASTDITTAANEDLTLTPNGTGNTIITSDFNSGVLVGSSSNTLAALSVSGGIGSNALLILNQTNSGDLLTASASGTTKFRIANNGDAVLAAALNVGGTNGTSAQCLLGGSSASWGSCSASAGSNWDIVNGVITPKFTSTLDFLLGSSASSSAKFAVLSVNSGTPTATISATTTGLSLSASGTIQSLQNATLTIGGNTTGSIILSPLSGSGTVSSTGDVDLSTGKVFRIAGTSTLSSTVLGSTVTSSSLQTLGTISTGVWQGTAVGGGYGGTGVGTYATGDLLYAASINPTSLSKLAVGNSAQVLGVSAGVPAWIDPSTIGAIWQIVNGSAQLKNTTLDLLLGATASTSAKFAVLNINSGTPTASISANSSNNATTLTGLGVLGTTNAQTLTLGNSTTGEVLLAPGATTALTVRGANLIAAGTLTGLTGLTVSSGTVSLPTGQVDNAELANSSITVSATAGTGISVAGSPVSLGGTLTVAGIDASTSVKGVASFNTANFAVVTGDVTIKSGGVTTTEIAANTIDFADISDNPTLDGTTTIALGTGVQNFNLVLGTNATNGNIVIQPNAGGQAALIVDKKGVNDIFTASASGTTRFTVNNSGDLVFGSTTRVTNLGVGTFITGSVLGSQTFTTNNIVDSGALTIKSGGTSALTLDTSGATAVNIGNTNATSLVFGNATTNPTFSFNGSGLTTLGGGLTFSGTTARTITGPATGGLTVNTTSGPLTLSTTTSGTLAVTSAGALNLTGAAASTWLTSGASSTLIIEAGATTANTALTLRSANQSAGTTNSGGLTILSGNAAGATSTAGNIVLDVGTSTTSNGSILIGTAARAQTITIGNSTGGVITIGAGSGSGLALNDAQWSITDAGAATFVSATSPTYTGAGAVTLSSGGTSGLTFDSASGDITVAANDGLTFAATTVGNNGSRNVTVNSGTGGTTATLLVKLDTSGTVITTDITTLNNAVGVALNTTTAGGAVRVAINGVVTATADNAVTAGDYIGVGTTTAGRAKSLGTTYPSTAGIQVIGRALGTQATPGSTFLLMLNGIDNNVSAGGGGGYNLIKDETISLTARTTLAFLGTAVTCADNAGLTQTECTMSGAGGGVSFASGTPDNTVTANNLIHLQKSGVNRFVVSNAGGLTINGTDSSVVRTTTTEFATGALLTNLTNANDQLELSDGTAGNGTITTAGQPVVNVAVGAGAQAITRADGKYQVIVGGGTALTTYDSIAGTFTASTQVLTAAAGAGALSLPRPDGRYRVIHGGGLLTTSLVDPNGVVAVGASVAVNASGNGTVAYRRANGRYLVTNGGASTTQIYNPVTDAFVAGPSTSGAVVVGAGALVLPRPDGQALIVTGGATNPTLTTQLYNPNSAAGDIGVFAVGPVLPTGCGTNAAGSIAIRKQDGKYIVFSQVNASAIYDPVANTWAQNGTSCTTPLAGKGPTVALADGAHAIPMQDGKFLIIIGGASTVANIYDPSTDTFTAHATAITAGGAGRHSIMRANGTWQLIAGGGTATNNFDTALPVSGTYQSDDISSTSLNASSTLKWTAQYESPFIGTNAAANTAFSTLQFLVRTAVNTAGLAAAVDREIITPGDFIRPASTDAAIRMTVKFNRPLPKRIFDERGTWMGNGNTVTRLDFTTPTLFDISVDNSTVLRRNNFAFTEPNAQTAAPQNETSGPVATRVEAQTDRLYLPYGRMTPLNQFATGGLTSGLYPGVISGAHPNLSAATTDGTIVIARPDRTFLVISGAAANASIYDPASSTFTAQAGAGNIPTAAAGTGAHAIKRPDGKFLVILGGAATTTNIYDPGAASGSRFVAGPATTVAVGAGANSILNTDGTFTILHGGAALSSSIYDPVRNTMIVGPTTPIAINCGSWAIPRPKQNQYLVAFGAAAGVAVVSTSTTYDAQLKIFSPTGNSPTLAVGVGCGGFVFQRQDGLWVSIGGAGVAGSTTGFLYSPDNNITTALGLTFTAFGRGGHVIPRADGTFLIVNGNASTATNLYIPWGGAFLAAGGPAGSVIIGTAAPPPAVTQTAVGAGGLSFQRPDGKWVIIVGGTVASAVTNLYDAGWYPDGQYLSEQVQVPALAANSTLEWKQTPDNYVRMEIRVAASQAALGNAAYFTVGRPGQSIANAGGETWVQVEANLRRDFPTFGGSLDGVYVSTGGMTYNYRNISLPTVFEYKLNNGMDLLNLQANGLNILRVTSGGNIYSSSTGGFYSGGADLAENYTSTDSLEKGEVVAIDPANSHAVKRAGGQYQNNVLGVVSTAPGFVAGAHTENSYPIALVGRVPVKVSTENGQIKAGDFLTSASIPGYAMKTNMAGRVLGKALEPFDSAQGKECPAFGLGNNPGTKCGEIMMFVNLTDYLGAPVELAMEDQNTRKTQNVGLSGIQTVGESEDQNSGLSSPIREIASGAKQSTQDQILVFLKQLKEERDGAQYASEVFTDRVSAVNEVITPHVITDLLTAKKIKADSIEGLEILTDKISGLSKQVAGIATSSAQTIDDRQIEGSVLKVEDGGLKEASPSSTFDPQNSIINFQSSTVNVLNLNANGGLIVLGPSQFRGNVNFAAQSTFQGETVFERLVAFVSSVIFRGKVTFEEVPIFSKDTAGFAVINKGSDSVEIKFDKEYAQTPFVNVTITLDDKVDTNTTAEEQAEQELEQKALEEFVLNGNIHYVVTKRTTKGFVIKLNKLAVEDLKFSWTTLAIKDARTSVGVVPTSSPAPQVQATSSAVLTDETATSSAH